MSAVLSALFDQAGPKVAIWQQSGNGADEKKACYGLCSELLIAGGVEMVGPE